MNKILVAVLLVTTLACERSPYTGYKVVGDDVHLHLERIGDGEVLPADSDSVVLRLRMGYTGQELGGVYSTERSYAVAELRSGAFKPVLRRIHVGDSLSIIAPAVMWPWKTLLRDAELSPPDTGMVRMEVTMLGLSTPEDRRAATERLKRNDPLAYERRLISAFLADAGTELQPWGTSLLHYHITGTAGDTGSIQLGDKVTVSYSGRRLEDGSLFDDSARNGGPLSFTYGDKDQVINGIEVAITLLRKGQEGRFLFPSELAFGAKGIPGVLDPHMPVLYTVRLVGVERGSNAGSAR